MKTEGELQKRSRKFAFWSLWPTVVSLAAVSLWTPFIDSFYSERWFNGPGLIAAALVPLAALATIIWLLRGLKSAHDAVPFVAAIAFFMVGFSGVVVSLYPFVLPPTITFDAAAAPASSLLCTSIGTALLVPVILGYSAYTYWMLRGKIDLNSSYH